MVLGVRIPVVTWLLLALVSMGCRGAATTESGDDVGATPTLPAPQRTLIPVVKVATQVGWSGEEKPIPTSGLQVQALARDLDHPRWLHVLPNGDVLVAETNAPVRPADGGGIRNWFRKKIMQRAGAVTPSADRITLLRDGDGDGVAELRTVLLRDLHSPFGMALVGNTLYVANTGSVVAFTYNEGDTEILTPARRIADLPGGERNHHWTKSLIASPDGMKLYVGVGSNSNVAENGMAEEVDRAAILEIDPASGAHRVFASGLRNPVGLAWQPDSGMLWTAVNERDELGDDLVPDYMTSVRDGGFYGWPYSYYGTHVDERVKPQQPQLVASALVPDYALGAHTASLGLAWSGDSALPSPFQHGMFIGQHGSWNRREPAGYRVIFVPFAGAQPQGRPIEVLGGFLDEKGQARGRPVGVAIDRRGALLVADDVGNVIWGVSAASPGQ